MRIPDEMALLIREIDNFSQRAIARELVDRLLISKTPGEITFEIHHLSSEWQVCSDAIWEVAQILISKGLVEVRQGGVSDSLVCSGMKSSSNAVKKKSKRLDMASIKKKAIESRANDLKLKDVGPSALSEISLRIPLDARGDKLQEGYQGWIPTALYGLDGVIFTVTADQEKQLAEEFPLVDLQIAFEMMFDDLKSERHSRPTVPSAPYWIRQWLKKHGESSVKRVDSDGGTAEAFEIEAEY
jgi:hypothetical protein